jgi:peptide deformylase
LLSVVKDLSPIPLMMSWLRLLLTVIQLPVVLYASLGLKALKYHNRPMKLLKYPHRTLQTPTEPITKFDKSLIDIIMKLHNTLSVQDWGDRLGMAAPQIGINKQVFLAMGRVFINPTIEQPKYKPQERIIESCYSVPGRSFKTMRYRTITANWVDHHGNLHSEKFSGDMAIVFQHEYDHLQGKCCVDIGEEIVK